MEKNRQIEDILGSLDQCQRALAPDFLYTRLKARLERENDVAPARIWLLKPAYAMAAVIAVLLLNAFILLNKNDNKVQVASSDIDTFQSIAADYRLNDNNNLYDLTEERQP